MTETLNSARHGSVVAFVSTPSRSDILATSHS